MKKDIIQIWVSYTEQANELTNKRLTMSSFFFALSAALLGISIPYIGIFGLIVSIIGVFLCIAWCLMIRSFRNLNCSKFKVIETIEQQMDIKPYYEEWRYAKEHKYLKITTIEMSISIILCAGYIAIIVLSLIEMIGII